MSDVSKQPKFKGIRTGTRKPRERNTPQKLQYPKNSS